MDEEQESDREQVERTTETIYYDHMYFPQRIIGPLLKNKINLRKIWLIINVPNSWV